MNLLDELNLIFESQNIPVETGIFSGIPPDLYAVFTPLSDDFPLFADGFPQAETQEVRVSVLSKFDYRPTIKSIVNAFLAADITITQRHFIEFEKDTKYFHYALDLMKINEFGG